MNNDANIKEESEINVKEESEDNVKEESEDNDKEESERSFHESEQMSTVLKENYWRFPGNRNQKNSHLKRTYR